MRMFLALALAGAFAFQVRAQEIKSERTLLCDTPGQVEAVVRDYAENRDQASAIDKVNKEAGNDHACVVVHAQYVIRGEVKRLSNDMGEVAIVSVLVVNMMPPLPQFSVVLLRKNRGA